MKQRQDRLAALERERERERAERMAEKMDNANEKTNITALNYRIAENARQAKSLHKKERELSAERRKISARESQVK